MIGKCCKDRNNILKYTSANPTSPDFPTDRKNKSDGFWNKLLKDTIIFFFRFHNEIRQKQIYRFKPYSISFI